MAAIAAFRLGRFHDRATYPICLPFLSVLVNYGKARTNSFKCIA
jgi:hypothetical protein